MTQQTGKYMIVFGAVVVAVGVVVYFFGNKLHWLGRLPGDLRIERANVRFYFPLATMLLFSILLTVIVNLLRKFL